MSQNPQQQHYAPSSFRGRGGGAPPRGRGGRGQFRGDTHRGGRGGRGRGGFHQHHSNNKPNTIAQDVDYSPEAIEARFSSFYLPSMTQDPWAHLLQNQN